MTQKEQGKAVEQIRKYYKPPFKYDADSGGYVFDNEGQMIMEVRGWGHLCSFVGDSEAWNIQNEIGEHLASLINASLSEPSPNQTPSPQPGNEQEDREKQAEVFLQNNFPSDYRYENDTISFRRIKPVIMLLQSQLSQEQTNHMHTRFAWDRTNEDRDNGRNEAKALTAIKKGLETSLSQAQEEIKALTGQLESAKGVIEFCGKENREQREEIKRLTPTTQSKP
jgi:hypothetical protein